MLKNIILSAILLGSDLAIASAEALSPVEQNEIISAHNVWRKLVAVPALSWSDTLANSAQAGADSLKNTQDCKMVHSKTPETGENLFWASALLYSNGASKVQKISATEVIDSWGNEYTDYDYSSNSCATGKVCGHYTQVVWKTTAEVGCGKAVCSDNSQVWVCQYSPAGNFIGERPY